MNAGHGAPARYLGGGGYAAYTNPSRGLDSELGIEDIAAGPQSPNPSIGFFLTEVVEFRLRLLCSITKYAVSPATS